MTLLLRVLACALLLVPPQLPAADTQSFISEKPYPVANIREPEQHLPVNLSLIHI